MFELPKSTEIDIVVPKNLFDSFTNSKQKKNFSDKVKKIKWIYKLSRDTINLNPGEIEEIQIFDIELKEKTNIRELLEIIQKAISYSLICIIRFEDEFYISTAAKHRKVNNENEAVIDYTFSSEWMSIKENPYTIELKTDLDWVFKNFCEQISGIKATTITHIVEKRIEWDKLIREIESLKVQIRNCIQFNKKVELNMKLKEKKDRLKNL